MCSTKHHTFYVVLVFIFSAATVGLLTASLVSVQWFEQDAASNKNVVGLWKSCFTVGDIETCQNRKGLFEFKEAKREFDIAFLLNIVAAAISLTVLLLSLCLICFITPAKWISILLAAINVIGACTAVGLIVFVQVYVFKDMDGYERLFAFWLALGGALSAIISSICATGIPCCFPNYDSLALKTKQERSEKRQQQLQAYDEFVRENPNDGPSFRQPRSVAYADSEENDSVYYGYQNEAYGRDNVDGRESRLEMNTTIDTRLADETSEDTESEQNRQNSRNDVYYASDEMYYNRDGLVTRSDISHPTHGYRYPSYYSRVGYPEEEDPRRGIRQNEMTSTKLKGKDKKKYKKYKKEQAEEIHKKSKVKNKKRKSEINGSYDVSHSPNEDVFSSDEFELQHRHVSNQASIESNMRPIRTLIYDQDGRLFNTNSERD